MVNSGSEGESRRAAADYMQVKSGGSSSSSSSTTTTTGEGSQQSQSPITASGGAATTPRKSDSTLTADVNNDDDEDDVPLRGTRTAAEPPNDLNNGRRAAAAAAAAVLCRVPLDKVQGVVLKKPPVSLSSSSSSLPVVETTPTPKAALATRKVLCLYCDRSFVSASLRQKHVERSHSTKQFRRVSSRRQQNHFTSTPCVYCDRLTATEHTLKELFEHLILNHSQKYFGCLPCEDRFLNTALLAEHNASSHRIFPEAVLATVPAKAAPTSAPERTSSVKATSSEADEDVPVKMTRSMRQRKEMMAETKPAGKIIKKLLSKDLRGNKKLAVKSSALALKRSKRLQAKVLVQTSSARRQRRTKNSSAMGGDGKKSLDQQQQHHHHYQQTSGTTASASGSGSSASSSGGASDKSLKASANVNPYPEFDSFFRVKKITDHSIDNLKISSLTFDDVFDKAFFNRIRCNIQENLLHHIDGKLFKNEESESRISNFEKNSSPQEMANSNLENYGCELSLNAVTPAVSLLSTQQQFGEDLESQIEYGAKPASKKAKQQTKSGADQEVVHYKYFTRRKYQASILEHKENRDLSKLDMWTQYVIKNRQQKIIDDKKTPDEVRDYVSGEEYKTKVRREELNRILDRRGPFEDLKEEASKKAAMDKLSEAGNDVNEESFSEIRELLTSMVNKVFEMVEESSNLVENRSDAASSGEASDRRQIPSYLNLRHTSTLEIDCEMDKSDRIALICSSQETENFELPSNTVRDKNEKVELTGEWARSRIFVCAACGLKLQNMKQLLEHKNIYHQYVWVQHYELVGNQSELYRHLSIPGLGKVGVLEDNVQCKLWKRSEARLCSKCGKQCNSLGELHRHILECGGDWTWMLARKKCKYRPFGAKSRRKRRGLVKRIYTQKTEPSEKKIYKKVFDGPRPKPSDAETIQRMLANLPPKRATRKIMCLKDGLTRNTKKKQLQQQQQNPQTTNQSKLKCGKVIHNSKTSAPAENKNNSQKKEYKVKNNFKRPLRSLNKVLASRVLDTNSTLLLKRKLKNMNTKQTRQSKIIMEREEEEEEESAAANEEEVNVTEKTPDVVVEEEIPPQVTPVKVVVAKKKKKPEVERKEVETERRTSPRNEKEKNTTPATELLPEPVAKVEKMNIKRFFPVGKKKSSQKTSEKSAKRKSEPETENKQSEEPVKVKKSTFSSLMRTLSLRKKKTEPKNKKNKVIETAVPEEAELKRKRKFGESFRNAVKKIKKLKVGNETEKLMPPVHFLEETKTGTVKPAAELEKIVIPVIEEPEKSSSDTSTPAPIVVNFSDEPVISGTVFDLHDENAVQARGVEFDTLKVDTKPDESSSKPQSSPSMVSPKLNKGKIRKQKGLSDCIAMLTSKLNQSVEESSSINSIFSLMPSAAKEPEKQCILKVPSIKDHLKLTTSSAVEEVVALDLSCHSHQPSPQQQLLTVSTPIVENTPCEPKTHIHKVELTIPAVPLEIPNVELSDLTTVCHETRKIGSSRKVESKKTPSPPAVILEIPEIVTVNRTVELPVLESENAIDEQELIQKKSKTRKIGQKRNKLRKSDDLLASKIDNLIAVEIKQRNGERSQSKLFLETNLDSVFNTREVSLEMFNEPGKDVDLNEPVLLENKPIISIRDLDNSKHDLVLDSEDELPLSSLLKIDGESLSAISEQDVDLSKKSKTKRKKAAFKTNTTKSDLLEKCMREKMLQLSGELHYCQDLMEEIENEIRRESDAMVQAEDIPPIPTIFDSVLAPENLKSDIENIVAVKLKNTKTKNTKNNADISIEIKASEATTQVNLDVYDFTETGDVTKQDQEPKKAETTKVNGEIKENNCEETTNGRRRMARSAKAKALENILDDALALAELTESERNREVFQGNKKKDRAPKRSPTRRSKKREEPVDALPESVEALPELDKALPASLAEMPTSQNEVTNEEAVQENKNDQDLPPTPAAIDEKIGEIIPEFNSKKSGKNKKQPKSLKKSPIRKNKKGMVESLPQLDEALPASLAEISTGPNEVTNEEAVQKNKTDLDLPVMPAPEEKIVDFLPELKTKKPSKSKKQPKFPKKLPTGKNKKPEDLVEILPELREALPELREALPELHEALPELREALPELREALPEQHESSPELVEALPVSPLFNENAATGKAEMKSPQKNKNDQNLSASEITVEYDKLSVIKSKKSKKGKKQLTVTAEVELVQSVSPTEIQKTVGDDMRLAEVKSNKTRKSKKQLPSVEVEQEPSETQLTLETALKPSEIQSKQDTKVLAISAELQIVQPISLEQVTVDDGLQSLDIKCKKTRKSRKEIIPPAAGEQEASVLPSEAQVTAEVKIKFKKSKQDKKQPASLELQSLLPAELPDDDRMKPPEVKSKKTKNNKKSPGKADCTKVDEEMSIELTSSAKTDVPVVPLVESEVEPQSAVVDVPKSSGKAKKSFATKKGKKSDQILPSVGHIPEEVHVESSNTVVQNLVVEIDKTSKKSSTKKNKKLRKSSLPSVEVDNTGQTSILLELPQQDCCANLELPLDKQSSEYVDDTSKTASWDSKSTKSPSRKNKKKTDASPAAVKPVIEAVVEEALLPKPPEEATSELSDFTPKRVTRRSTISLSEENAEIVQTPIFEKLLPNERSGELVEPEVEKKTKKARSKKKKEIVPSTEDSESRETSIADKIIDQENVIAVLDVEDEISKTPSVESSKKSKSPTRKIRKFEATELSKSYEFEDEIPVDEKCSTPTPDSKKSKKSPKKKNEKEPVALSLECENNIVLVLDDETKGETSKTPDLCKKAKKSPNKKKKATIELSDPFDFEESSTEAKVDDASSNSNLVKKSKKSPNKKNEKEPESLPVEFEDTVVSVPDDETRDETSKTMDLCQRAKRSPSKNKKDAAISDPFEFEESSKEMADAKVDDTSSNSDMVKKSKKSPNKKNKKESVSLSTEFEDDVLLVPDDETRDETFKTLDLCKKAKRPPNKNKKDATVSDPFEFKESSKEMADAKVDDTTLNSDLDKTSKKSPNKKNKKESVSLSIEYEDDVVLVPDNETRDETSKTLDLCKKAKRSPNKNKKDATVSDPFEFEESSKEMADAKVDDTSLNSDLAKKSKKPPNKKTKKQSNPFDFEESDTEVGDVNENSSTPSLDFSKTSKHSKDPAELSKSFEDTVVSLPEEETSLEKQEDLLENALKRKSPDDDEIENPQELRRSKRNSRKITSYNEAELANLEVVVPDVVDSSEKNSHLILEPEQSKEKPKMNSDELFDLLKATPNENNVLTKPPASTFFNNFDEISDDFNDDNFDMFENILEKSMAVIEENLAADRGGLPLLDMNLERDDVSISEPLPLEDDLERPITPKDIDIQMQEKLLGEEIESKLDSLADAVPKAPSKKNKKTKKKKSDKVIHCEICDRSFRIDNLNKHQRTLVHISKLSEIEAREAELKAKRQSEDVVEITSDSSKNDLNLFEVLDNIESASKDDGRESPASFTINNQSLKLADIIDDVLNKPSLSKDDEKHNFSDIIMQNPDQLEIRRYKSLGERKSFDADQPQIVPKEHPPQAPPPPPPPPPPQQIDYFDSTRSNEAGTILEKQLTLLQNMIENRTNLSYIDDISISSAQSDNNSMVEVESAKQNENLYSNVVLKGDSFLKPTQYEEISEDSTNLRSYDDQKSRKALNRDEELFLECCSLLKSSSEVSNYSKKSNKLSKVLNNLDLMKSAEEPDWLENKSFSRSSADANFQDSSRIPTPLGDNFANDESNSNTIASNWNMTYGDDKDKPSESTSAINRSFSFEEVLNDDDKTRGGKKVASKFGGVISKALHSFKNRQRGKKRNGIMSDDESSSSMDNLDVNKRATTAEDLSDSSTTDSKKMLTKGAMKVFEGLKVSIPTEELNMKEVLNSCISQSTKNPQQKSTTKTTTAPTTPTTTTTTTSKNPTKKLKLSLLSAELFSKITNKKKPVPKISKKKSIDIDAMKAVHDIYDFEETQDNSDVFAKPDFRSFRNKKSEEPSKVASDGEDGGDSLSFEASSTSSVSEAPKKATKSEQNITKNKCMIMGRIFKNAAAKSRIEEEIREIPTADSAQLVEDFVRNCPKPAAEDAQKKPKMTEEEMNKAFDMLLNGETKDSAENPSPPPSPAEITKPVENQKKRSKVRYKKRSRAANADDETDDEFSLSKLTKKRTHRKNEDNSINLEQELKECIGVASRKSQRKCTSGKQNVLVEYWSSDESTFEIPEPVTAVPKQAAEKEKTFTDFVKPFDLVEKPVEKVSEPIVAEVIKEVVKATPEIKTKQKKLKPRDAGDTLNTGASSNRRKRAAANPLYHWSSSSEDESSDLILVKPIRDETEDDDDRPVQHGWIVGDSPKKLVTMLAQAKGKKLGDVDSVKEQGKKRTTAYS